MINFYRDFWKGRAHHLAPIMSLTKNKKKGPIVWSPEADKSFEDIKKICVEDSVLYYSNFNQAFEIHTDSSYYQMGAIITQKERLVVCWSKKLSYTPKKYPITDQELLAIVECLKQYKTMLFGQRITVWIDHKNLTFKNTERVSDRVLRQRFPP